MKKYFVLKGYRDIMNGSVDFQTDSLEDAKLYADMMRRNMAEDNNYVYSVGTFVED